MTLPRPPILVITDRRMAGRPLTDVVASAIQGGCRWILLREPDLPETELVALGRSVARLCSRHGATLSVSANIAAAATLGAAGVHLPQRLADNGTMAEARGVLGKAALIGVSCHSLAEAKAAKRIGADYVTFSPVFLTESKPGYGPALGLAAFASMAQALDLPVVALGGIGAANAASARRSGAAGIAVMGSIMRAADPAEAFAGLRAAWEG